MVQVVRALQQVHDPIIAFDNLALSASSITASSEEAGFNSANLFNYFTFDGWKPSAGGAQYVEIQLPNASPCDYFAFYNQNIFEDAGEIKLQYWDGSTFSDIVTFSPLDNSPQLITFTEVTADLFRVSVTSTNPAIISCVSFGKYLSIPFGLETSFNSPHNAQHYFDKSNESETGNFIGRSVVKRAASFTIATQLLEYDWFREYWRPFIRHAERRPFWFKWSNSTYSDESVYCWNDGEIATPTPTGPHFMSFTIALKGLVS